MRILIFQTLEFTVLIPGMLLAYLPVRSSLKQTPKKLAVWMFPLLIILFFVFVVLHAVDSICQQDLFFFLFYLFYLFYIITLY